jgi:hypothetical protein
MSPVIYDVLDFASGFLRCTGPGDVADETDHASSPRDRIETLVSLRDYP